MCVCGRVCADLLNVLVLQGAVHGPEEFAEGFVIGVQSLLGHTVGKINTRTHFLTFEVEVKAKLQLPLSL